MAKWIMETSKNEYLEYDTKSKTWEIVKGKKEDKLLHLFGMHGYGNSRIKKGSGKYTGNMTTRKVIKLLKTSGVK